MNAAINAIKPPVGKSMDMNISVTEAIGGTFSSSEKKSKIGLRTRAVINAKNRGKKTLAKMLTNLVSK